VLVETGANGGTVQSFSESAKTGYRLEIPCRFDVDKFGAGDRATCIVPIHKSVAPAPIRLPLSSQMALDAAMVGARSARIGMFAEAIAAISAYCGCPWGRRVGL
jgi:hypothetical protein